MHISLVFCFLVNLSPAGFAQSGIIMTLAGDGARGFGGDGGPAILAQLSATSGVAVDSTGSIFIADLDNNRVRKVTATGVISTVAGNGSFGFSGDGGPAKAASLNFPVGIAVDTAGNLYIADAANHRIRKVTPDGIINTVAGTGTAGFSVDGGSATAAQLDSPLGVAVDSAGNIYIADFFNHRVRRVSTAGVISTVAGNGAEGFSGDGGPATAAQLGNPTGVAVDSAGSVYVVSLSHHRIRKVSAAGVISTVAGNGTPGFSGDGGPATAAQVDSPIGVAVDSVGNLYIPDLRNHRIRRVTPAGVISTVAGTGTAGFSGDGGPATLAGLNSPIAVAVDSSGSLYIADRGNFSIRKVTAVNTSSVFFPQVAVGGGYTTLFTITNLGATAASGNVILTDQQGNPLTVNAELTDSSGFTQPPVPGSAFELRVPAGGIIFLLATGLTPDSATRSGWAQLDATDGALSAVATYEYTVGTILQARIGVLHTQPLQFATIPVNDDSLGGRRAAFAVANPGNRSISVDLMLVGQDGTVLNDRVTLTLGPREQVARFVSQDFSRPNFRGSLVLRGQAGATFVAVALEEKQGFLTVIPLIPGKPPGVAD